MMRLLLPNVEEEKAEKGCSQGLLLLVQVLLLLVQGLLLLVQGLLLLVQPCSPSPPDGTGGAPSRDPSCAQLAPNRSPSEAGELSTTGGYIEQ